MSIRRAELAVLLNGAPAPGAVAVDIQANAYLGANRFVVSLAYSGSPLTFPAGSTLQVEIRIGLSGQWQSLLTGNADSLGLDPIRQEVTLHGRDLTSLLIASQTAETFENQTASDIVTQLAERHGLIPVVTNTDALVGRYFQDGRTRSAFTQHASATSEWDVVIALAEHTGFDTWVDGTSLYFQPAQIGDPSTIVAVDQCMAVNASHALDLATGPSVIVKSWDCQQGNTVSATAGNASMQADAASYTFLRPNLSFSDANSEAQRILSQLSTHEFQIECDMPGDLSLMPRDLVTFQNIGGGFDGAYRIMEVNRRLSFAHGFVQSVLAKGLPWTAS